MCNLPHAHSLCPAAAPHGERNSLSNQPFLLSMSQLWPSLALCTLLVTTRALILNPKAKSDKQGRFFIMCILFLSFRLHREFARLSGTCQSCWARALSLLTLHLQSQEELIRATLLDSAGLGSFQKHWTVSGDAGDDSVSGTISCDSWLRTLQGV